MKFITAKAEARAKDEGKGTTFYKHGIEINQKRIEKSVKRKREHFEKIDASTVGTLDETLHLMALML
jgi:hypothetical protein